MKNNYVNFNITPEEYFKHYCQDEHAIKFFESYIDLNEENEKELNKLHRTNEVVEEQLGFAEDLLTRLERELDNADTLKEFKKKFKLALSESMFER